jgi:hypothetical protein
MSCSATVLFPTPTPDDVLGDVMQVQWQVRDDEGHWIDYDKVANDLIEAGYQKRDEVVCHQPGAAVIFRYYTQAFIQESGETRKRRPMRRILIQEKMMLFGGSIVKSCDEHNTKFHKPEKSYERTGRTQHRPRSASRTRSFSRGA